MSIADLLERRKRWVVVTLTKEDVRAAIRLADERERRNREAGIMDRRFGFRETIGFEGVLGEFAVAKYLGIEPDLTTHPRSGGPDIVFMGVPIDVKFFPGSLDPTWTVAGHKRGVVFVFACGRVPDEPEPIKVRLAGWLTWKRLKGHKAANTVERDNARVNHCYRVKPQHLLPMSSLIPSIKEAVKKT